MAYQPCEVCDDEIDVKVNYYDHEGRLLGSRTEICTECCTHDDRENGHCIDCGHERYGE